MSWLPVYEEIVAMVRLFAFPVSMLLATASRLNNQRPENCYKTGVTVWRPTK